jgi:long-chain acyl-CoA synthetase
LFYFTVEPNEEQMIEQPWFRHYDPYVPHVISPPHKPVHLLLEEKAKESPDQPILVCLNKQMRYKELIRQIDAFAAVLYHLGVKKGDRICFLMPNLIQFPVIHFAVLKIGAVSVPVNPVVPRYEIDKILRISQPRILIVLSNQYEKVRGIQRTTTIEKIIVSEETDYASFWIKAGYRIKYRKPKIAYSDPGVYRFRKLIRHAGFQVPPVEVTPEDTAVLLGTGSRTGQFKLAALSHQNLVSNTLQVKSWVLEEKEHKNVLLAVLPLFHSFGMTLCLHFSMLAGIKMVSMPLFSTGKVLKAIEIFKVTHIPVVPTMIAYLLEHPEVENTDFSSLKVCLSGGMKLDPDLQSAFESIAGVRIMESYGLTEASPAALSNPFLSRHESLSVGIPIPSTLAKIVDPETGVPVATGEEGELIIKGPQVMKNYWNDTGETTRTIRNGWLFTGDKAKRGKEGYFYITGRYKEVIIYGGFNVFPREVEEVLLRYPAIQQVKVTGIPDKKYGEVVKAVIVPEKGISLRRKELKDFCRNYLAGYKIPRIFEFVEKKPEREGQTGKKETKGKP